MMLDWDITMTFANPLDEIKCRSKFITKPHNTMGLPEYTSIQISYGSTEEVPGQLPCGLNNIYSGLIYTYNI